MITDRKVTVSVCGKESLSVEKDMPYDGYGVIDPQGHLMILYGDPDIFVRMNWQPSIGQKLCGYALSYQPKA